MPTFFHGIDALYYIEGNQFLQTEPGYKEKAESLISASDYETLSFRVGRNNMSDFYYRILPQLQEIADISEINPELIDQYLIPEVQFSFYLDASEDNLTCQAYATYGNQRFSLVELLPKHLNGNLEAFHDSARENEVYYILSNYFPELDVVKDEFHCEKDETLIYQVMENGTSLLQEYGEVRCTKRFLSQNKVKKISFSVGVSVSSGLLELDITTDEIERNELLDLLSSYRLKKKYYRLKNGSFVNLEDDSLEMLKELMDTMQIKPKDFVKGKMHLPMYRTLYLDKMLEEHDEIHNQRDRHFKNVVKEFKTLRDADYEEPHTLSKIMRKYQKDGYKWMRILENWKFGGILADDMGLGKTLQVIAGTQTERKNKLEAIGNSDVIITSYDLLKRDISLYEEQKFHYEIIDEAQYIKNHTTAAAKAVKVIRSEVRYALTGTPIENRLSELWSIFDYLMPGMLYGYDVFKREFETPIVKHDDDAVMKRLQKMTSPFILRRLKDDVLKDLPEKLEENRYVRFENRQQQLYDAQVVHMKNRIASQNNDDFNKNKLQVLAELTKLRQICCDPSLCFENYHGESAKLQVCMDLIHSAIDGGHRMLIFSQFTSMLEILQKALIQDHIPHYTITGSTTKEQRLQLVKEFNEGSVPVFLISLKAGGVGLNLIGADIVIHYDPWWNKAAQNQATDRAHRIGQTKKVTVYKLIAKNTIEEKIQQLQEKKKNLADQIISGEMNQISTLSKDELLELLDVK